MPLEEKSCFLGIDVGSTTVKYALINEAGDIILKDYKRGRGKPSLTVFESLTNIQKDLVSPFYLGFTGSGGERIAKYLNVEFINEVVAQPYGLQEFVSPKNGDIINVIEMGGQDSKFMILGVDAERRLYLQDSVLNDLCAAGTGSFLDQQAERLGVPVETIGDLALIGKDSPANIAGRCTVFCKSDMVHLQQVGVPLEKIVAGLCLAVARNFKQTMINKLKEKMGKTFLFQGGVAYNKGMVWAFEEVIGLKKDELVIPLHKEIMAAMGVAQKIRKKYSLKNKELIHSSEKNRFASLQNIEDLFKKLENLLSLNDDKEFGSYLLTSPKNNTEPFHKKCLGSSRVITKQNNNAAAYLGIDIGSTTSKVVVIDQDGNLIFSRYLYTEGKPVEIVKGTMKKLYQELGDKITIKGAGITGSGRFIGGQFIGADLIIDEINAQALGITHLVGKADAIIDIGGQDSKFIILGKDNLVRDFVMNKACAAGTGTFLEEQAKKLKLNIKNSFSELAFSSDSTCNYNATCSVFMEQDLVNHQQKGASLPSLVAGLAVSMVKNYLRSVAGKGLESLPNNAKIVFTGGVANNNAVVSAFLKETGHEIIISPYKELSCAIGTAIAVKNLSSPKTKVKDLSYLITQEYKQKDFICKACSNVCTINAISFNEENPVYYGARCEKFDEAHKTKNSWEDLVKFREDLFFSEPKIESPEKLVVGVPRVLAIYDLYPFFYYLLRSLGMKVVLSEKSNANISHLTNETCKTTTCSPAKLVSGHVKYLLDKGVDLILLPTFLQRESIDNINTANWYCNYIGAAGATIKSGLGFTGIKDEFIGKLNSCTLLYPPLDLSRPLNEFINALSSFKKYFGWKKSKVKEAVEAAWNYQEEVHEKIRSKGKEILNKLEASNDFAVVLTGRPYNIYDPQVNGDVPRILRNLGAATIPAEYLDIRNIDISWTNKNMFWHTGQWNLRTGQIVKEHPLLYALYLSCFGCGPDSFILSFFSNEVMKDKQYLYLEIDDHTGRGGIQTRCEAFVNSIKLSRRNN